MTTSPQTIGHWLDGQPYAGTSGRTGEVFNPATGEVSALVAFADRARSPPRSPPPRRLPGLARHLPRQAHPGALRLPRAAQRPQERARRDHHRRARQGPLRRPRRGGPRPGGRRVRLRHPAPAQGRRLRRTSPPASTSTPSASRSAWSAIISPVQLPGDGADVVLPDRHRRGQHRGAQAQREGPVGRRSVTGRAVGRGRPARRRVQRRPGRQGRRRRAARPPRRRGGLASSAPPRSPGTSTRPATAHGKRVQALGGAKNHMVVLPDADLDLAADAAVNAGFGSAGERCMAISVARRRRPRGRRAGRQDRRAHRDPAHRRRRAAAATWARWSPSAHRDKVARTSRPARRRGASVVVDGRSVAGRRRRGRLLARPDAARPRHPGDERLHRRDLRPGALRGARRHATRRRWRWSTPTPTATAPRSSPTTAARPAQFQQRGRGRHGRHQRADPGADGATTPSAAGRPRCSATPTPTAPRACTSSPVARSVTERWLDPSHGGINLGFPQNH